MSTTTGIKLDEATKARLQALGEARDRSPHWLMKQAIAEYIEREEAVEREKQEDEARLKRYHETGEYVSHEKIGAWINSLRERSGE